MNDATDHSGLLRSAVAEIEALHARVDALRQPIAIVGIGCRLPGANGPETFWARLRAGDVVCDEPPPTRAELAACFDPDPDAPGGAYVRRGAYLDNIEAFDAAFFRLLPAAAAALDPQHRMLLETSWSALEDAGIDPAALRGSRTGVYVGLSFDGYAGRAAAAGERIDAASALGGARSLAAGRISYFLDLHGPAVQLDTACSSSAFALHAAVQALRMGECDLALAGGANAIVGAEAMVQLSKLKALSPAGRCRSFEAAADGYGRGEGAVLFALRRLPDAEAAGDRIHALILGSAANHDGASNGLTAPNAAAQEAVILAALSDAAATADQVGFIEAHGTGTPLGDPIEAAALSRVFAGRAQGDVALGSVKCSFGHLEAAAGALGLLKAAMAVREGELPAQAGIEQPTRRIDWNDSPLRLADRTLALSAERPLAGVSSFGMSGTNVHLVIGPAPPPVRRTGRRFGMAFLSAASEAALRLSASNVAARLRDDPSLDPADVERSLLARSGMRHRAAFAYPDNAALAAALADFGRGAATALASGSMERGAEHPPVVDFADGGAAAAAFVAGAPFSRALVRQHPGVPLTLDPYPFERDRHWIDAPASEARGERRVAVAAASAPSAATADVLRALLADVLEVAPERIGDQTPFIEIGADSLILLDAIRLIEQRFGIAVEMGALFEGLSTVEALSRHIDAQVAGAQQGSRSIAPSPPPPPRPPRAEPPRPPSEPDPTQQSPYFEELVARYSARHSSSKARARSSRTRLADSRRAVGFRPSVKEALFPIVGMRGEGAHLWDVDGNRFTDVAMGFGVYLFGHRFGPVEAAIDEARARGLGIGPQSPDAGAVATALCRLTGFDRAAFCNSGTEAVMTALRLARAATGRQGVALFSGSYHGHFDGVLGAAGAAGVVPATPGVAPAFVADLLVLEYGADSALDALAANAGGLAAILVEPVQSRHPDVQPAEFLRKLRTFADRHDVALIFDEVLTGLRVHPAGAQGLLGVKPDLATYGKVLGGGLPIGAVAGGQRFLDGIDGGGWDYGDASSPAADRVFFGGTFNKNALSMAAARAVLDTLAESGPDLQESLNARTSAMAARLTEAIEAESFPVSIPHFGSLFRFAFAHNADAFYLETACRGVYIWEGRNCFLSTAHDDTAIDHIVESAIGSLHAMRAAGLIEAAPRPQRARSLETAALPPPAAIAARVRQGGIPTPGPEHEERTRCLDAAATAYALAALEKLGLSAAGGDAALEAFAADRARSTAAAAQLRAFAAWRAQDGGGADAPGDPMRALDKARSLGGQCEAALVEAAGDALADVLRGARRPIEALAPGGDLGMLSEIYVRPGLAQAANRLFERSLAAAAEELPADVRLDVLEIGAGTGSATGRVLSALGDRPLRYRVTDVSLGFFGAARWPHAADPRLDYGVYDIDRPALEQGLHAGGLDIVVASNALHVATDLDMTLGEVALLLRPGGLLILNELTVAPRWLQLVFGLTDGWWRASDGLRLPNAPLLPEDSWRRALHRNGLPLVQAIAPASGGTAILVAQKRRSVPATRAQRQLHALAQLQPEGGRSYNLALAAEIAGPLDVERLAGSIVRTAERHDLLRAVFDETGASIIFDAAAIEPCARVNLTGAADSALAAQAWLTAFAEASFDLARGPLFRSAIVDLGGDVRHVALAAPHIASDGMSLAALWEGAVRDYRGDAAAPAPSFADYARAQQEWLAGAEAERCRAFWRDRLSRQGAAAGGTAGWSGGNVGRRIAREEADAIQGRAADAGLTPFMFLFAAFGLLLGRTLGERRVTIGVPVAGRRHAPPGLVGYCAHLLPVSLDVAPHLPLERYLRQVRDTLLEAYAHQDLPFAEMPGDAARIDYTFNLDDGDIAAPPGLTARLLARDTSLEPFALRVNVTAEREGLRLDAGYQDARFGRGRVEHMLERYDGLLRTLAAAAPGDRLCDIRHCSARDAEAARSLEAAPAAEPAPLFPAAFLAIAAKQPEATAIRWQGRSLGYGALAERALAIAAAVAQRAQPHKLVAVDLPREPDLVAAFIGVMLAGCAYVPMDPSAPPERRAALLAEARPALRIAAGESGDGIPTLRLDLPLARSAAPRPLPALEASALAYAIATSGSTGKPKLVGIEHRALAAFLRSAHVNRAPSASRLVAAASPATFDVSIFELFGTLSAGGSILLVEDVAALMDPSQPVAATWSGVPSALAALDPPPGLEDVGFGGEALPQALADRYTCRPDIRVRNVYGPTETTVYCLEAVLRKGDPVTLGRPLPHASVYILDPALRPVGVGEIGEIYVAAPSLARGYLGQPGLTARAFLPNPFGPAGDRMYRTGDRGRVAANGEIEFLGRRDGQVKLNGIRVEVGEVEAALLRATGLGPGAAAAAIGAGADGRDKLVAFATAPLTIVALREALAPMLPPALHPSAVVQLESLPLNASGKLDRKRLSQLAAEALAAAASPSDPGPMSGIEARIAECIAAALQIDRVGADDDFFALGGDSIVALQAAAAARRADFILDPKAVLIHRTVRAIAQNSACAAQSPPEPGAAVPGTAVDLDAGQRSAILSLFEAAGSAE